MFSLFYLKRVVKAHGILWLYLQFCNYGFISELIKFSISRVLGNEVLLNGM